MLNHFTEPKKVVPKIQEALRYFFRPDTLVINDTRSLIKPEVIPHIPFVGYYDSRITSMLSHVGFILSDGIDAKIIEYFEGFGLCEGVVFHHIDNNPHITLTENILYSQEKIDELKSAGYTKIFSISSDKNTHRLAREIGASLFVSAETFTKANDKAALKRFLLKNRLPTVSGVFTSDKKIIKEYFDREEHYFFKSPYGVSGYGFWSNKNNTLDQVLAEYGGQEIIIERVIAKVGSPSVQFCIWGDHGEEQCIFGFTDQILEGGQHYMGNSSPSAFMTSHPQIIPEIIRQSEEIIEYIASLGYVGFGGIDYMIDESGILYATEVNARCTGATYPAITSILLYHEVNTAWQYMTHEGQMGDIAQYLDRSIRVHGEYGVFPICITPLEKYGRVQVLEVLPPNMEDI